MELGYIEYPVISKLTFGSNGEIVINNTVWSLMQNVDLYIKSRIYKTFCAGPGSLI